MIIYDFFSGTGSSTKAFEDAGHTVIRVEIDEYFQANERNILQLTADYLINKYGKPDFIWASPPCQTFSVASIRHYWTYEDGVAKPKNQKTLDGIERVRYTLELIGDLNPTIGWLMENPRGMLRKQPVVAGLTRRTVTYCQYGDTRMKPTDIWGYLPEWTPKPMCKAGMDCHKSAPSGSTTGTQGMKNAKIKSMIPYDLGKEILEVITNER